MAWKAAAPEQKLIFLDTAVSFTKDKLELRQSPGQMLWSRMQPIPKPWNPSPPPLVLQEGRGWQVISDCNSCNKAGNSNCYCRHCWLAKKKKKKKLALYWIFKSLVVGKLELYPKNINILTVKNGTSFRISPRLCSLTSEAILAASSLCCHTEDTGSLSTAFLYFCPAATYPGLKHAFKKELRYWLDRN